MRREKKKKKKKRSDGANDKCESSSDSDDQENDVGNDKVEAKHVRFEDDVARDEEPTTLRERQFAERCAESIDKLQWRQRCPSPNGEQAGRKVGRSQEAQAQVASISRRWNRHLAHSRHFRPLGPVPILVTLFFTDTIRGKL